MAAKSGDAGTGTRSAKAQSAKKQPVEPTQKPPARKPASLGTTRAPARPAGAKPGSATAAAPLKATQAPQGKAAKDAVPPAKAAKPAAKTQAAAPKATTSSATPTAKKAAKPAAKTQAAAPKATTSSATPTAKKAAKPKAKTAPIAPVAAPARTKQAAAVKSEPSAKPAKAKAAPAKVAAPAPVAKTTTAKPQAAKTQATKTKTKSAPKTAFPVSPPKQDGASQRVAAASPATGDTEEDPLAIKSLDVEKLATNLARVVENSGKALAAYLQPREGGLKKDNTDGIVDMVKTLGSVADYWMTDPQRSLQAQSAIAKGYMELWTATLRSMGGEPVTPVVSPAANDKRFKDPQWSTNPVFDFFKQFYLVTSNWADDLVKQAEIEPHLKQKADFYTRQLTGALSPSNFAVTNPEVLRETFRTSGDNLVRGTEMLAEDIAQGGGDLKIRQSDETPFEMGRNIAVSPGKVVYQNDLIQLIQYEPTTAKVGSIPLLIVPPWINKFYILDLSPEKSFIKWAVDQGLTVFVVSWVNPDASLSTKSFAEYVKEGPLAAMDVIGKITGRPEVHTIGYCVGGTLMACTLGYLAEKGDSRIVSNTFFTTQVDFTYAGDLLVFADEENIASVERQMQEQGFLEGKKMANAFNMLRSNDLIWPYIVNNYMKGKKPMPFDLLYWNADATRMPAANHSFYLRHCYLQNDLSNGRLMIDDVRIDLKKVKTPIYNLAAREDHIAPARSVFVGSQCFGGPVTYVMSGSGHIAGVVNPPSMKKYQFWTGGPVGDSFEEWVGEAKETPGSWWPHWRAWVASFDKDEVDALVPGKGPFKAIEDAPGSYVKVKA